ncbi:MAG TPA: hypothetical protein VGG02_04315, partial [Chthoniobacterales bacterium]
MKTLLRLCLFACVPVFLIPLRGQAGSATWDANPPTSEWDDPGNWTQQTIPYGESDIATFGPSNVIAVELRDLPNEDSNTVSEVVFTSDAPAYTITAAPLLNSGFPSILQFYGAGITNNSGVVQNFYAPPTGGIHESGRFIFFNSASAGSNVVITNGGSDSDENDGNYGGFTEFDDTSTAADAMIISQGGTVSGAVWGGFCNLVASSNADRATFIDEPGTVSGAPAGHTLVQTFAPGNIGKSTFINNSATVAGAEGGWSEIDVGICAGASFIAKGSAIAGAQEGQVYVYGGSGNATFSGEGGTASGGEGGLIDLFALPNSSQTVVIAKAGKSGGLGGHIVIENKAVVDMGQFRLLGNGWLDLSVITNGKTAIGSLAGSGLVSTAGQTLTVGNNNLDTTFSGIIEEGGSDQQSRHGLAHSKWWEHVYRRHDRKRRLAPRGQHERLGDRHKSSQS